MFETLVSYTKNSEDGLADLLQPKHHPNILISLRSKPIYALYSYCWK